MNCITKKAFSMPVRFFSSEVERNKEIADKAIRYARSIIASVPTRGIDPPMTEEKIFSFTKAGDDIIKMRHLTKKIWEKQPEEKKHFHSLYSIVAHLGRTFGCGNSEVLNALVMEYLSEKRYCGQVGLFVIETQETPPFPKESGFTTPVKCHHTFFILGLEAENKRVKNDFKTLAAKGAVVGDPTYEEKSYSLCEMPNRLRSYYGINLKDGSAILRKNDAENDEIRLVYTNICTSEEFRSIICRNIQDIGSKEFGVAFPLMGRLLTNFHSQREVGKKLKIADQIIEHTYFLLDLLHERQKRLSKDVDDLIASQHLENCCELIYMIRSQLQKFKDPRKQVFDLPSNFEDYVHQSPAGWRYG